MNKNLPDFLVWKFQPFQWKETKAKTEAHPSRFDSKIILRLYCVGLLFVTLVY